MWQSVISADPNLLRARHPFSGDPELVLDLRLGWVLEPLQRSQSWTVFFFLGRLRGARWRNDSSKPGLIQATTSNINMSQWSNGLNDTGWLSTVELFTTFMCQYKSDLRLSTYVCMYMYVYIHTYTCLQLALKRFPSPCFVWQFAYISSYCDILFAWISCWALQLPNGNCGVSREFWTKKA